MKIKIRKKSKRKIKSKIRIHSPEAIRVQLSFVGQKTQVSGNEQ
jgi:hypothetical protein